jgi:hypothetical protein
MISILERVYDSTDQRVLSIRNGGVSRPLQMGSGWTAIRMGIRWTINLGTYTGALPNSPLVGFGVCHNPGYEILSQLSVSHFVGTWTGRASMTPSVSGSGYHIPQGLGAFKIGKRVGATFTLNDASSALTSGIGAHPGVARNCWFLEITKGTPNWALRITYPTNDTGSGTDIGLTDFIDALKIPLADLPDEAVFTNYQTTGSDVSMAVDESGDGSLTGVWINWNRATWAAEISDMAVYRVA